MNCSILKLKGVGISWKHFHFRMAMARLSMPPLTVFFLVVGALKQALSCGHTVRHVVWVRSLLTGNMRVPIAYLAPEFPVHHTIHGVCVLRRNIRILLLIWFTQLGKSWSPHEYASLPAGIRQSVRIIVISNDFTVISNDFLSSFLALLGLGNFFALQGTLCAGVPYLLLI